MGANDLFLSYHAAGIRPRQKIFKWRGERFQQLNTGTQKNINKTYHRFIFSSLLFCNVPFRIVAGLFPPAGLVSPHQMFIHVSIDHGRFPLNIILPRASRRKLWCL